MIVSFTPNPAVDKTLLVAHLRHGGVNRTSESHVDPGGKGINVSRMVHRLGRPTLAVGILGGHMGKIAERALRKEGVPHRIFWVKGETRLNVILVDQATAKATKVWDKGPRVPRRVAEQILPQMEPWLEGAKVFVAAGSVPRGLDPQIYVELLHMARARDALTILDADGETLEIGMRGRPDVIKPNRAEVERLLDRKLPDREAVVAAARELQERGPETVIISMGAQGSIVAAGDKLLHVQPPRIEARSTVGSGDSLVAGVAISMAAGAPIEVGLRLGTAAGAATAMTVGTHLGERDEVAALEPEVEIEELAG